MNPFSEYSLTVEGLGLITVIAPEGEPGYRVRLPDGQVTAFAAISGDPSEANAAADIAHALANPPPAPVPHRLTRSQFITAIRVVLGLNEGAVYALITAHLEGEVAESARDLFENALHFYRANPTVIGLAVLNGNTPEQLDEVFRLGATLYND